MKNISLKQIGYVCYSFRRIKGYRQKDIADDLGMSEQSISLFENGKNNSATILLWYIRHGLTINEIAKGEVITW